MVGEKVAPLVVVYLDLKSRTFHHKPKYDFKKYLIKMAGNANAVVNALTAIVEGKVDWRDEPTMAHQNCLALKICAIIQVFSMFKTYNLRVGSMVVKAEISSTILFW